MLTINSKQIRRIITLTIAIFIFSTVFSQNRPPEVPADDPYFKLGYLDVRLFGADNTGTTVCTNNIRNALLASQKYKLACYFPSGTYLVDDTITAKIPVYQSGQNWLSERRKAVHIVGAENPRPVIKLVAGATGYENGKIKPIFWLWGQMRDGANAGSTNPEMDQSNINFNMVIRGLNFDLSENPGAVAIRFAGAQCCTIEDIKVNAKHAYAGFFNCVGQGGGNYNIEVEGGKYAWYFNDTYDAAYVILAGIKCKDQEISVIRNGQCASPILISGFHLELNNIPIINKFPTRGGITMIDGMIDNIRALPVANVLPVPGLNLYMKNVYLRNCEKVILDNTATALTPNKWNEIKELKYLGNSSESLINGELSTAVSTKMELGSGETPTPIELIRKHTWDSELFLSVGMRNDADFVNVKDPDKMTGAPGIAKGDGTTNDTKALQWAIDHYNKVFVPTGTYQIDSTLFLRSKTQLIGSGKVFSIIQPMNTWKTSSPKTLIKTNDDINATTNLSFIGLQTNPLIHKDMVRITWQCGSNSMIRDLFVGASERAGSSSLDHQILKFSGPTTGGRIYAFASENGLLTGITENPAYREILVENTTQPLRFYGLNTERISSGVQVEIRNSSNVEFHYFKSEATVGDESSSPLLINNSNNIRLYCMAGKIDLKAGMAIIRVEGNCNNILATCVKNVKDIDTYYIVKEIFNSVTKTTSAAKNLGLFYRNASSVPAPSGNSSQSFCKETLPTIANLVANGSKIKWYENAVGGDTITSTTALVSGKYYFASQTIGSIESVERLFVVASLNHCTGITELNQAFSYFIENNEIIIIGSFNSDATASLFDLQGRIVTMLPLSKRISNSISIKGLKSGIYILKVMDKTDIQTTKLYINN